eukprot:GEMP01046351.1.p1 GENE.GEMP01046351.1~~GEMP01046351.1.p1  ORF type:complete len:279 (+),score=68.76 GEMP01046351.1:87-923(+)
MKWTTLALFFSAAKAASDEDVVVLTDANFQTEVMEDEKSIWFVEFYAPWCGHCKNLEPVWNQLATDLKGKVNVGKVDATQETVVGGRFNIQGFPSIKLFPAGVKSDSMAVDYEEGRDLSSFTSFALRYHAQTVEAEQLIGGTKQLKETCDNGLCVLAFLPHILDSQKAGREKYLKDFNTAARGSGGVPCTFLWSQGGDQYEFEEKLNLGFGYPALVAIHLKKGKFGVHRGSFEQESIRGFLTSLMSGRVPLNDLPKELPKIYKADAWDGEEGKPIDEL